MKKLITFLFIITIGFLCVSESSKAETSATVGSKILDAELAGGYANIEKVEMQDGSTYVGEMKDGVPHGIGKRDWGRFSYQGEFKNGKGDGIGLYEEKSGTNKVTCLGEFKNDVFHGGMIQQTSAGNRFEGYYNEGEKTRGTEYLWNGIIYEGTYENGERSEGIMIWPDGSKWQGKFGGAYGEPSGIGTYVMKNGDKWIGEFFRCGAWNVKGTLIRVNGEREEDFLLKVSNIRPIKRKITYSSQGVIKERIGKKLSDGSVYLGTRKDGELHGRGVRIWPDDTKYIGEWKDGKCHGAGIFIASDGMRYKGEWKDGEFNGKGDLITNDWESRYIGDFKNSKAQGVGIESDLNGIRYEGSFQDNQRHGKGILYIYDGTKCEVEYKNGKPYGKAIITYANGIEKEILLSNSDL